MPWWSILILLVAVSGGLFAVMFHFIGRNYTEAMRRLQALSAENLQRQEELKQKQEEAERHYQEQVGRAQVEAERLVADARQEAETTRARTVDQARAEGERIVQQARDAADSLKKELDREIAVRSIERACDLLHAVLPGELRQTIQSHWLDELVGNGLAKLDAVKAGDPVTEATVVSAFPLNDEQRRRLKQWLKDKLGHDVVVTETADEGLVAGMTITLGSLMLDGSLASRVRRAAREAQERT